ncbi:Exosome complex component Rrp41 like [Quillaja saponaria]|uniref:Exosome complex component Rrp41 like n=1 Tax=Quillaja saponaria TaxID=32244 RepID=A0AAD7PBJ5_QUISA|nr:Exosome complex component Rrp41 like [Quillaja saponaria]
MKTQTTKKGPKANRKKWAMEFEDETLMANCSSGTPWSYEANWTMASGSLENSVTCESSMSAIDDGHDEVETTVDLTPKSPLVLYPPPSDSIPPPFEIKISFMQKHEVRQVYVRSTARVCEIYYAPNMQSSNEYLCTIQCGIASRDGEVLHTPNIVEVVSLNLKGSNKDLAGENIKNDDDWVEVKVPDTPMPDEKNITLQTKPLITSGKTIQDLYEATAQITDGNPCISLTLRLLSLQSKGCIYVDEVYVFADPVVPADSESEGSRVENSSKSSLLAMFMPTILQLSKTTGVNHTTHCSDRAVKQEFPDIELEPTRSSGFVNKTQREGKASITDPDEVKLPAVSGGNVHPSQQQIPSQVSVSDCKSDDLSCGQVQKALEQLVSRMERMENFCMRFQEKMLNPINSIEIRLQRVEQQLEIITTELQSSKLPSCSRFSAPDMSFTESESNSCDNSSDKPTYVAFELGKKDLHLEGLSVPTDDLCDSLNTTLLLPSLVVKAPVFPSGDDEEEHHGFGIVNSSNDKQRQSISIDDALASALAGFISSVPLQSPKYTRALTVKAPEFSNEDVHENKCASPRVQYEMETNHSVCLDESERTHYLKDSVSTSSSISCESKGSFSNCIEEKHSEETTWEAEKHGRDCIGGEGYEGIGVKVTVVAENHGGRMAFSHITDEDENGEVILGTSDDLIPDRSDIPNQLLQNQTGDSSDITQGGLTASSDLVSAASEVKNEASSEDIVKNVLGFSRASSSVDFDIPLTDVKFISQQDDHTKSSIESLFSDMPETNVLAPPGKESDDDLPIAKQCNLISVDEGAPANSATESLMPLDMDYCNLIDVPTNIEAENIPEYHIHNSHEMFPSSLI